MAKSLKKLGGCSSTAYAGISDNYMLLPSTVKGGYKKRNNDDNFFGGGETPVADLFKGGYPFDMRGGEPVRKSLKGGEPIRKSLKGGNPPQNDKALKGGTDPVPKEFKGGVDARKNDLRRKKTLKGGEGPENNALSMLSFGSAMKGFTDNLTSLTNLKGGNPLATTPEYQNEKGGCPQSLKSCNKNSKTRGGTTGIELAPFISSLIMLGLRAANDKSLQSGITKKLGSMVSESKKSKSKSKSKRGASAETLEY